MIKKKNKDDKPKCFYPGCAETKVKPCGSHHTYCDAHGLKFNVAKEAEKERVKLREKLRKK